VNTGGVIAVLLGVAIVSHVADWHAGIVIACVTGVVAELIVLLITVLGQLRGHQSSIRDALSRRRGRLDVNATRSRAEAPWPRVVWLA
jgi:hypothetical protein